MKAEKDLIKEYCTKCELALTIKNQSALLVVESRELFSLMTPATLSNS
jgi:hypothetical protein